MNSEEYFDIPTKEQLRNKRNLIIIESSDEELYKSYYETLEEISYYKNRKEMIEKLELKQDVELIKLQFIERGLKIPFDYTNKNILNVHLGFIGFITILTMRIIVYMELLSEFSNKTRMLLLSPFALIVLIGVINLIILSITNEKPIRFFFETLMYDLKNNR